MPGGLTANTNGNGMAEADAIMKQDADKGVAVHSFDPDASPQEKAAQVLKNRDHLSSVKPLPREPQQREIKLDNGHLPPAVPTIVIEDHGDGQKPTVKARDTEQVAEKVQEEAASMPGNMPAQLAGVIPDWYKVGWRQVSGIDRPHLPEGEERDRGVLDMFLSEQFYGAWYHNAAIIVLAVFVTHFLTRFNFGWGWLFIILAFCSTYYTASMERFRRYTRDDIQRELVKTRLLSEHESADWINNFLDRFWLIYEPVLSATIVASADQILSSSTPAFLDSLRLTHFTLGTKAPRIDSVRTFPKTEDDVVMMDWGISFTPKDTSDMTQKQIADQSNPKITLSVRLGKGLMTAALPILVEDISLSGLMRIRMKLMSNFPHVQIVDICFLEQPVIGYVLKPIGGDTLGFDIASIPGLSSFIREMTHATLGPMMYDPNVFSLNLEQMLSGKPLDTAIGVVQVVVQSARGIQASKIGGGSPDPYVSLAISNRAELARTQYKSNTYNPTWMETKFLLVNSLKDNLTLSVFDYNEHRKNTLLGFSTFEFSKLLEDATQEGIVSHILKEGKERGELRYDINYYPVIEVEEGKEELLQSTVGIVRLVIHQAKELDHTKSLSGELSPLAKVYLNSSKTSAYTSPCFKHTNSPVWEAPFEYLCTDKDSATVTIKAIDERDFLKDPVVGYMSIKLTDLLNAKVTDGQDWFPLSGCKTGKVRLSAEWKPLSMAGSLHSSDQYKPPIGVVKLLLDKAIDVKNVEATLGGKSDPYVRVQVQNVTKGRTEVINNNLNPVWDEIIYIPVHSLKDTMMLECMDYQHLTKDRSLGSVELHVSDLAVESPAPEDTHYLYQSKGLKSVNDPILLDKGNGHKGTLHYTAEFIPALNVKFHKFENQDTEVKQLLSERQGDGEGGNVMDGEAPSDDDDDDVPPGVTIPSAPTSKSPDSPQRQAKHSQSVDNMSVKTVNTTKSGKSTKSNGTEGSKGTKGTDAKSPTSPTETGVEMSHEELLAQQSGIIVFHVISGNISKKARVEVLVDDGYWPCFTTVKARSTNAQWGMVGEGFMKEVDFGRVWLKLNEATDDEKDDIIAEWKGDAKEFLQATMNGPITYALKDEYDRNHSTVTVEARYIPVPVRLEPRESVNNQGILRVELIDGHEIPAVDRGGKSDPFAVFSLNGHKVFKSSTKKKTITPEWNENFEVTVPSRYRSDFSVEIFDWNQIEQSKSLGVGKIDLTTDLEPFEAQERHINLVTPKHGEKGQIRIRMVFQPEIIAKSRKNTSTFTSAGRAMTHLSLHEPAVLQNVLHGVTGVFKREKEHEEPLGEPDSLPAGQNSQSVGVANHPIKASLHGVTGVFRREKGHEEPSGIPASLPTGQNSQPVGVADHPIMATAGFPSAENSPPITHEPGTLRVTVLDAKDLSQRDAKPYAMVRLGDKQFKTNHTPKTDTPQWNETFVFAASALTPKMLISIHDHKTIGKDKEMGDAEVDIWRHIKPEGVSSADVFVELKTGGIIRLRLEFDAESNPNGSNRSIHSGENRTMSMASPSRFSIRGRRPNDHDDSN